jgi:hypothetical protein
MRVAKARKDFYQINKMERNKNNANAINAISIGTFSAFFFLLFFTARISNRKCKFSQSLEDG